MSATERDDFSSGDIRTLGERAAYICANPACRRQTIGPHTDPNKSLKTGKACHIKAASPGGPRYDPAQTREERTNIQNGIWLCSNCSDLIDKDAARFAVDVLREWRESLEAWIRDKGIIPKLPEISLTTLRGLSLPDRPGTVKLSDLEHVREHTLGMKNISATELFAIEVRVQLAEPILESIGRHRPAGALPVWEPIIPQMILTGGPGATATRNRPPSPTNLYRLAIEKLPPQQFVEIGFITSTRPWDEREFSFDSPLWEGINEPPMTAFYFDGTAQFDYQGARLQMTIFAPISYDKSTRHQSFREVRDDYGPWKRAEGMFFG